MDDMIIWIGILFCITQSAMFSGLNLAFFSFTRLRLEIEADSLTSIGAQKVLKMRKDSNFLLTTILWGNVGINVLLTLLSDSVMAGVASFLFSTVIITMFGEIIPQAYFSRHSLKMASLLAPVLKLYQFLLYPVAKPSALLLDAWLGKESIEFFKEKNVKVFLKKHVYGGENEIDLIEGIGAINFLSLDDMLVAEEGERVNPKSIVQLDSENDQLIFPTFVQNTEDHFIQKINDSGEKWIILTNKQEMPIGVLDADGFLRSAVFSKKPTDIKEYCHIPIIIRQKDTNLGVIIKKMRGEMDKNMDNPIEKDMVLFWTNDQKIIITGADVLGRLLKGI
ncbi:MULTISPECIES: DUF21 domain-containing protein [unclassified Saccharicrinis]|uniref:DUF21 domain-containing protein n=1 Tax=unclassified Saccharicrinis TaxID=2646859 RepID=UPI003D334245